MSTLDKEFRELIQSKIDAAAALIEEANQLASSKGESLYDLSNDYGNDDLESEDQTSVNTYDLIVALDNAGWQTSSMGC